MGFWLFVTGFLIQFPVTCLQFNLFLIANWELDIGNYSTSTTSSLPSFFFQYTFTFWEIIESIDLPT
jgi:hypothetical protein